MKSQVLLVLLICGIALSQNVTEILVEFSNPVLSNEEKKTCTTFPDGIEISFTITNQENITDTYEIPEGEFKLINKDDVSKEIQTACILNTTSLICIPMITDAVENGVYYVKLSETYNISNTSISILNNTLDSKEDLIYVNGAYKKIVNTTILEDDTIDFKDNTYFGYEITYDQKLTELPTYYAYKDGELVGDLIGALFVDTVVVGLDIQVLFVEDAEPVEYELYSSTPCGNIELIKKLKVKNTGKPIVVFRTVDFKMTEGKESCTNMKRYSSFDIKADNAYYLRDYQGFNKLVLGHPSGEGNDVISTRCNRYPLKDTPGSDYYFQCFTNDFPPNDGDYYAVLKEHQEGLNSRLHKFVSSQYIHINKKYAKLKTTTLEPITHDYLDRDRGDIELEFESKPNQEVKAYIDDKRLVCDPKLNSTLICYFTETEAPAGTNGAEKTYTVKIKNACDFDEGSVQITVKKSTGTPKTQVFLGEPTFPERKCNGYEKGLSFDVPLTIKYATSSSITFNERDAILYLDDSENNFWFNVTCYHKENVYNCQTTSDSLPYNQTGLYRFRFEEYDNTSYLIYSMSSANPLNFTSKSYSEPVNDHFESTNNFKSAEYGTLRIEFKTEVKDRPTVVVNEKQLYCYNEGPTTMACKYDRLVAPPKNNSNKYETYEGYLVDVCGNKEATITVKVNDYKKADKTTVIVGAVLGTCFAVILIASIIIIMRCRKKNNDLIKQIMDLGNN